MPCDQCRETLLDFVYGLLEESAVAQVRAHVTGCAACQAALVNAQAEQKMFARAARAVRVVPEFAVPSETPAQSEQPATLPLTSEPALKRPIWKRPIVGWAVAAAILIAVGASLSWYRYQRTGYETDLTTVRKEHK